MFSKVLESSPTFFDSVRFGRYRTTKRLELVIDACLGLKQMCTYHSGIFSSIRFSNVLAYSDHVFDCSGMFSTVLESSRIFFDSVRFGRYRTTKRLELVIDACLGLKQMYKDYEEFNASRLQPGETNVYTSGRAISPSMSSPKRMQYWQMWYIVYV